MKKGIFVGISIMGGIFLFLFITIYDPFHNADRIYRTDRYEECKDSFEELKCALITLKDNYKKEDCIGLWQHGDSYLLHIGDSLEHIDVDKEIVEKIKAVSEQYKGEYLDKIFVYDDQITFGFEENTYAIIYRKDNTKPPFMNSSSESFGLSTWRLEKYWY
ncbi:hypothetical protein, partial [Anaerosporobacter sp.]|uniref:hypothetical protein n=1 Tax=Anaerosporobacter sp. TaxID=1872529 RepID=UPI00286F67B7